MKDKTEKKGKRQETSNGTLPPAVPQRLDELIEYAPGSVVSRTLIKHPVGTDTLFSFDAGQGLSEHTAPFDALVEILDGRAELTIGGNVVRAEGDRPCSCRPTCHTPFTPPRGSRCFWP